MKSYLEGCILQREQRSRSKSRKQNPKTKEGSNAHITKVRLKASTPTYEYSSVESKRKHHERNHTQIVHCKAHAKVDTQSLNKTHSKIRLQTQVEPSNHQTIRLTAAKNKNKIEVEQNPLLGVLKDRFMNDSKTKRHPSQNPILKKLLDLTQKARRNHPKSIKNPEESIRSSSVKQIHRCMEMQVKQLKQDITKQGRSSRQISFCEALKEMVSYTKEINDTSEHRQERLLTRVKQLQQRNVRLMSLMNRLKRQGVDVDSFWVDKD